MLLFIMLSFFVLTREAGKREKNRHSIQGERERTVEEPSEAGPDKCAATLQMYNLSLFHVILCYTSL